MIQGRVWKYGHNIDTEEIYPARYLVHFDPEEVAKHVMEDIDPDFSKKISPGDIIVAGKNFGCGSAREQAATAIKFAKIGAVVADSFCRTFYRNALNNALPVACYEGISDMFDHGDELSYDMREGIIKNITKGTSFAIDPLEGILFDIFSCGGAVQYYKNI